ncbi:hypothetical protein FGO68_gene4892 [Halteria grandinella]|uniref:RING-type domain-containing protein n=1 Tax=Halteria grandinella TaxID=5974 RepID=A0A8J8NKI4_HALGN|nr:hypothetical protein FGO68_gene4892 [Halteria grandinella]
MQDKPQEFHTDKYVNQSDYIPEQPKTGITLESLVEAFKQLRETEVTNQNGSTCQECKAPLELPFNLSCGHIICYPCLCKNVHGAEDKIAIKKDRLEWESSDKLSLSKDQLKQQNSAHYRRIANSCGYAKAQKLRAFKFQCKQHPDKLIAGLIENKFACEICIKDQGSHIKINDVFPIMLDMARNAYRERKEQIRSLISKRRKMEYEIEDMADQRISRVEEVFKKLQDYLRQQKDEIINRIMDKEKTEINQNQLMIQSLVQEKEQIQLNKYGVGKYSDKKHKWENSFELIEKMCQLKRVKHEDLTLKRETAEERIQLTLDQFKQFIDIN